MCLGTRVQIVSILTSSAIMVVLELIGEMIRILDLCSVTGENSIVAKCLELGLGDKDWM